MEENFTTFGFDNISLGVQKYLDDINRLSKASKTPNVDYGKTALDMLPVAMAYVPMQTLGDKYPKDLALKNGTLFPELDKPFLGRRI